MPPSFELSSQLPKGYVNKQNKRVSGIDNTKTKEAEEPINLAYTLKDADRELSDIEIDYENKSITYDKEKHRRIKPSFGTLGYMFRNLKGGNNTVIGALRASLSERGAAATIKDIIIKYDSLDEYSQLRTDVWDLICKDLRRPSTLVWNFFLKGIKLYVEALKTASIELNKPDLVDTINKFSRKEANQKDRELAAKVSGLIDDKPLVSIEQNDNRKVTNNTVNLFGKEFSDTIREVNNQLINDNETKFLEPKSLTEGTQDYIDAEFEDIKEHVLEER
jgi:hypothetical protein